MISMITNKMKVVKLKMREVCVNLLGIMGANEPIVYDL